MGTIKRNFANSILSTGKFDATKLTGDIPTANLSANAPATDLNPLRNDVATLALREAVNSNRIGTNLVNSFIDQFEDASGIDTTTNSARNTSEYVSSVTAGNIGDEANTNLILHFDNNTNDSSGNSNNPTGSGGAITFSTGIKKFGTHSASFDGSNDYILFNQGDGGTWFGSGDWAYDFWCLPNANANNTEYRSFLGHQGQDGSNYHQLNFLSTTPYLHSYNDVLDATTQPLTLGSWNHVLVQRSSNVLKFWVNGNLCSPTSGLSLSKNIDTTNDFGVGWDGSNVKYWGYMDEFRLCKYAPTITSGDALYTGDTTSNFTPPTSPYAATVSSATGNFTSTTINPADSTARTKLGLIVLYKDNAGTNALNTDIVAQVSADNGSNYSTCTLTPRGNFDSSGTKIAIANDVTVTSGTDLKYKISFANQASGTKEARITGVSLIY